MRNRAFRDFMNLSYIELLKIKNFIKASFRNPLTALKSFVRFFLPFIAIVILFITGGGSKSTIPKFTGNLAVSYVGAVVMLLLCVAILYQLNSSAEKYNPTQFTISDVHYLFPSPIGARTIYAWTMFKQTFSTIVMVMMTIFVFFYNGSRFFKINMSKTIYVIAALFIISILLKALDFFIYSLSIKFKIEFQIKVCVKAITIGLLLYLLWSIKGTSKVLNSIVYTLNGKFFSDLPIIGWTKEMIISPLVPGSKPILPALELFITTCIVLFFAVYLAEDYYEEASTSTEYREKIINSFKNKNDDYEKLIEERKGKKVKKKIRINIGIGKEFKGAWAFIWKTALTNKRTKGTVIFNYFNIIPLIVALAIGYFFRNNDFKDILALYGTASVSLLFSIATFLSPLKYELQKQYIYLMPGKARNKILAVHAIAAAKALLNISLSTFPVLVFAKKVGFLDMFSIFFTLSAAILLIYLAVLIITMIMSINDDGKNAFFIYLINCIIFLPAILMSVIVGITTKSIYGGLFTFGLSCIGVMILLITLSDWLFSKIELR